MNLIEYIKKNQLLGCLYCVLISIYYTLAGWTYNERIFGIILILAIFCGVLQAIGFIRKSRQVLIIIIPLLILVLYKYYIDHDSRLLVALLAIYLGINIEWDNILQWVLYAKVITFVFVLLFGGYIHINYVAINSGILIILLLCKFYKSRFKEALIISLLLYVLFAIYTRSGAFIICCGLGILLFALVGLNITRKALKSILIMIIFPLMTVLNLYFSALSAYLNYHDSEFVFVSKLVPDILKNNMANILIRLDGFLSGRIRLGGYSLMNFGTSFWGGNIDYTRKLDVPYFLVDSGYMLLIQNWGLLITVIFCVLFTLTMHFLNKKSMYGVLIFSIVIALWGFNEDVLLTVGYNVVFFCVGKALNDFVTNTLQLEKIWKKLLAYISSLKIN